MGSRNRDRKQIPQQGHIRQGSGGRGCSSWWDGLLFLCTSCMFPSLYSRSSWPHSSSVGYHPTNINSLDLSPEFQTPVTVHCVVDSSCGCPLLPHTKYIELNLLYTAFWKTYFPCEPLCQSTGAPFAICPGEKLVVPFTSTSQELPPPFPNQFPSLLILSP